jgi:hypothetical protein
MKIETLPTEYEYGTFWREGSYVEYTGKFPPKHLEIVEGSLTSYTRTKKIMGINTYKTIYRAEVVGWTDKITMDCEFGLEEVYTRYNKGNRECDTHNFTEKITSIKATIPKSGKYLVTYEKYFNRGEELVFDNVEDIVIKDLENR